MKGERAEFERIGRRSPQLDSPCSWSLNKFFRVVQVARRLEGIVSKLLS